VSKTIEAGERRMFCGRQYDEYPVPARLSVSAVLMAKNAVAVLPQDMQAVWD
jgi:hypothetical protein